MTRTAPSAWSGSGIGFLAVVLFSLTLPVNAFSLGELSPFATASWRALLAGAAAAVYLFIARAPLPPRRTWATVAVSGVAVAVGYPLLSAIALDSIDSSRAGLVLGLLPVLTALLAVMLRGERPPASFWMLSAVGTAVLLAYLALRAGAGATMFGWADLVMLLATLCTAVGVVLALDVTVEIGSGAVLSWGLVAVLPLSIPAGVVALVVEPPAGVAAWAGVAYLGLFSQFAAFGLWYEGLRRGGVARVSQIQQLQPVMSVLWAAWLLGERVDAVTIAVGLVLAATIGAAQATRLRRR